MQKEPLAIHTLNNLESHGSMMMCAQVAGETSLFKPLTVDCGVPVLRTYAPIDTFSLNVIPCALFRTEKKWHIPLEVLQQVWPRARCIVYHYVRTV